MGSFSFVEDKFIYTDQEIPRVLLDLNACLSNKSRISFQHSPDREYTTVDDILRRLLDKVNADTGEMALPVIMLDTLLTAQLVRSSRPFRILEYGCQDGLTSSHIAELLGLFHEGSELVCAYNSLDLTSMAWMERIADVEHLPKISYFAGDYGCLGLQKHSFDLVFLNGAENFENPGQILSDALELVTEDGVLLCYTDDTPLLESTFRLFFEEREEYELSPFRKIFLAKAKDRSWEAEKPFDFAGQIQRHLEEAEDILSQKRQNREEILALAESLHRDCRMTAAKGDVQQKIQLLEQKERLLSYLVLLSNSLSGAVR